MSAVYLSAALASECGIGDDDGARDGEEVVEEEAVRARRADAVDDLT